MKNNTLTIGLDVGNYDTKTSLSVTPSGFTESSTKPFSSDDFIFCNNTYYVPDNLNRFPYERDKTINKNCFILSLFGIAKEIIFILKKRNATDLQLSINNIEYINLGIGLPPTHCSTLSEKTLQYYKNYFMNGIQFTYSGYNFNLKLSACKVFPQDYAAVIVYGLKSNNANSIVAKFKTYYAIDIGGWTVDIVTIIDGKVSIAQCDSKPLGILKLYEKLIADIETDYGLRLTQGNVEDILKGEPTIISETIKEAIYQKSNLWLDKIIHEAAQFGVQLDAYPIVFIGGGSQILKKYINKCKSIKLHEFIPGNHANAEGYKRLLLLDLNRG